MPDSFTNINDSISTKNYLIAYIIVIVLFPIASYLLFSPLLILALCLFILFWKKIFVGHKIGYPISASILFLCIFNITLFFFWDYIDPDAVAYITIARRYATGDWMRAINGLWSPFSSWLVAIPIIIGVGSIISSIYVNAIACISIIFVSFLFFEKFHLRVYLLNYLVFILPVFLLFCCYYQLFADLWQVFFLLCYLLVVTSPAFLDNRKKWVLCGVFGALAYFAKAYSFYFIVVHLLVSLVVLAKQNGLGKKAIIKPFATVLLVMLVIMSPWLYALHKKYNIWTLSTASSLNESWFLIGHKTYKPGITYLVPPPYDNSPCNWEDPYINEGHTYKPWEQPRFILVQAGRSAVACWQTFIALHQLSIFLLVIFILTARSIWFKKGKYLFNTNHKILMWASLIMPLGYLAIHMEARYIWLLVFTGIVFGSVWLNKLKDVVSKRIFNLLVFLFAISFIVYPVYKMKDMFLYAREINQAVPPRCNPGSGSFTSNGKPAYMEVTALKYNMQYYTLDVPISHKDLLAEMRRYHIKYYMYYFTEGDGRDIQFSDENSKPFPVYCTDGHIKIFIVNP